MSQSFGDLRAIPARTVLLLEQHEFAARVDSRIAPRIMQQHHREQSARLGLVGHQRDQDTGQANRLRAEIGSQQAFAGARCITFVEYEVDNRHHGIETLRQQLRRRHLVGNPRRANLAFGANQPLRHRGRRGQERACDFVRREPAQSAKRERDAGVVGQRGMTTRKDQPQTLVGQRRGAVSSPCRRRRSRPCGSTLRGGR